MEKLPELGEVKLIKEGDWTRRYLGYWPEDYPEGDEKAGQPACQHPDGSFEYWRNRVYHRPVAEGPAFHYFHESPTGKKQEHIEYRFEGNLHCTFGPACQRTGDWKSEIAKQTTIYSFFGVNVPPDWTEKLTVEKILKERNDEVRRVGVQVYGIEKFVEETIKETIDADIDNRNDARALVLLKDDTKWLVATDGSTGRVYYLRVPDATKTCVEAYGALTGLKDEDCVGAG